MRRLVALVLISAASYGTVMVVSQSAAVAAPKPSFGRK